MLTRKSLLTRRGVMQGFTGLAAGGFGLAGAGVAEARAVEVTRYRIAPKHWPNGLDLRLAVLADIHACEPWMGPDRLARLVAQTNALGADAILLLGDYVAGRGIGRWSRPVPPEEWAPALGALRAPLGVHAVLGNHDWWDDPEVQRRRRGPTIAGRALEAAGIPVYENTATRVKKNGHGVWIAGLGDQWAFLPKRLVPRRGRQIVYHGVHDLKATLADVHDGEPVVLMAHEPDIFPEVPARVSLTVSGHTHGGQVRLFGYAPFVPSRFGRRFAYGHVVEAERHLVVSGGLGCSGVPVRFGAPPEIVLIDLGAPPA